MRTKVLRLLIAVAVAFVSLATASPVRAGVSPKSATTGCSSEATSKAPSRPAPAAASRPNERDLAAQAGRQRDDEQQTRQAGVADSEARASTATSSSASASNAASFRPSLSRDGRFSAFASFASNLVAGDTNGTNDVFLRDRGTASTVRASVSSAGVQANSGSATSSISADGRYVAFDSWANNLVAGDTNGTIDVFLRDTSTSVTTRLSVSSSGYQADKGGRTPSISANGRYVVFESAATTLGAPTASGSQIYVRDTALGSTTLASLSGGGALGNREAYNPAISDDGRYVSFDADATNLVPGDTNGASDVFVRDRSAGSTQRVSVTSSGQQAIPPWFGQGSVDPDISSDGRYVAFVSWANNLSADENVDEPDVYLRDRSTGSTRLMSVTSTGVQGLDSSFAPTISDDGRYAVFQSYASNLVNNDTNGRTDVFEKDAVSGRLNRLSYDDWRGQGNGWSEYPVVSGDGTTTAFQSTASNLAVLDANTITDVLVHVWDEDRQLCTVGQVSIPHSGVAVSTKPVRDQYVYRIYGGDAGEFGDSWTPLNPWPIGPDVYRVLAGLPDRLNSGQYLVWGRLDSAGSVATVRTSRRVSPLVTFDLPKYQQSGVAYRSYDGGLIEYLIPNAALHIIGAQTFDLTAGGGRAFGGPPVGCTPAPRGCVGEGLS